jgi:hypothetical protein
MGAKKHVATTMTAVSGDIFSEVSKTGIFLHVLKRDACIKHETNFFLVSCVPARHAKMPWLETWLCSITPTIQSPRYHSYGKVCPGTVFISWELKTKSDLPTDF